MTRDGVTYRLKRWGYTPTALAGPFDSMDEAVEYLGANYVKGVWNHFFIEEETVTRKRLVAKATTVMTWEEMK